MTLDELKERFSLEVCKEPQPEAWGMHRNRSSYRLNEADKLISLNLYGCALSDADFLNDKETFGHLQVLNLSANKLQILHIPAFLLDLQHLDVSENADLHTLTLSAPLPALRRLAAENAALRDFAFPQGMTALEKMELQHNKLSALTFAAACPRLSYIDASNNQLTGLRLPGAFPALQYLYLNDNQLERLVFDTPPPLLDTLHLRKNNLQELPANLLGFTKLKTLYLHGNPLPALQDLISSEERGNSWPAVESWLRSFERSARVHLHQAKMVLVGNGEVGKTSLQRRLINPEAPLTTKAERTHGLEVANFWLKNIEPKETELDKPIDFLLNIWDFGGQGKYREVQQIFCSRKTLYLFVTAHDDQPKDDDYANFEYWLSLINAFGLEPNANHPSPVIHVVTKKDEQVHLVDEAERKALFQNINGFVKVSSKTLENFEELRSHIKSALKDISADVFKAEYSQYWIDVKDELERRKGENYISKAEYLRVCESHKLDEKEAETWLPTLERIGTVIHFGEDPVLKDWVILNPEWAKNALYKVLESELVTYGIVPKQLFKGIWAPDFPEETHEHLIAFMHASRLCFEWINGRGEAEYVIPALLPMEAPPLPAYLQSCDFETKCVYAPFIPPGTVNKLMVALQDRASRDLRILEHDAPEKAAPHTKVEIYKDYIWKNNLIVHDPVHHAYAHVWENWQEKSVYIRLFGKQPENLFEHICKTLESLNHELKAMKNMSKLSFVPQGLHKDKWIDFDLMKTLSINFFTAKTTKNNPMSKPKIFISYAHKDEIYKDELITHLSPLVGQGVIETWNDRQIESGLWDPQIEQAMEAADIFLLLITPNFLASRYIREREITTAYGKFKAGKAKIFPVICDFCQWDLQPLTMDEQEMHPVHKRMMHVWLGKFQPFPKDAKPITDWDNKNKAYFSVIQSLTAEILKNPE